jgi:hypothetical protein
LRAIPSASVEVDPFVADPEFGRFAARYRESVIDCARPDPDAYEREIGLKIPAGKQASAIVRCYNSDRSAIYFISFSGADTRWFLYKVGSSEPTYAGVLLTRGIGDDVLKKIWDDHAGVR